MVPIAEPDYVHCVPLFRWLAAASDTAGSEDLVQSLSSATAALASMAKLHAGPAGAALSELAGGILQWMLHPHLPDSSTSLPLAQDTGQDVTCTAALYAASSTRSAPCHAAGANMHVCCRCHNGMPCL